MGAAGSDDLRLRIVSINDVYSLENLPRLKRLVQHHLEAEPRDITLFVIAGDFVAPTILSALDGGRGMIDCLNALGITHASLGNHENDIPPEELHRRVAELRGTWLSTNVDFDVRMRRSAVIDVGRGGRRVRVGLVGVVMDDAFAPHGGPFGGAAIRPPGAAVLAEAARLVHNDRCDCVIAMTHQPIDDDRQLALAARAASLPIPVIIGGHEHVPFLEHVADAWIVKSGMDAAAACITDLVWRADSQNAAPRVAVMREPVIDYPEDQELRSRVDAHMAKVGAFANRTLVEIPAGQVLSSIGARAHQTSLGTLLCSRVRDALHADACLINGGSIRGAHEYQSRLTYADLASEIPFANELVVARMPGRVLRDAVAASRARAPSEHGGFLQVDDGVVMDGDVIAAIAGAPLDPTREYRVALVRNFFAGLDHIEPLERFARERPQNIPPPTTGRDLKHFLVEAFAAGMAS